MSHFSRFSILFTVSILSFFPAKAQQASLFFDGVDDKVVVPANPAFNSANALTVEAWINALTWKPQQWQGTIAGTDVDPQTGYVLRCGANGKLSFTVGNGNGNWTEVLSSPVMQTNSWYHVAGVMDNGTLKIYINGNLAGSNASAAIAASTANLNIGWSPGFTGRGFNGCIDELRIWNIARTQSEIATNDTVDLPSTTPGLVAYYKFNQTSGTTTPNEMPTTNTLGTLTNFTGNPWFPGYVASGADIKTTGVVSPDQITFFSGTSRIKAVFTNTGTSTITSLNVGYKLNSNAVVNEVLSMSLAPGAAYEHAFQSVIQSAGNNNTLKVFASLVGDINPYNDSLTFSYNKPGNGDILTIPLFTNKQHNFAAAGQTHLSSIPLPDNNAMYKQIIMNISLACPATGCDPWDQPAKISLIKNGQTYELARFITPYGKACGPWQIDVTSFKSLLQGSCDFESYIQVWGASGWLLNASLTFVKGYDPHPYQRITALWDNDNWVYGEPTVSYDLPDRTNPIHPNTQATDFRMTITGHGQANTDNAAEFSPKTHLIKVNGNIFSSHYLWKADCASNSCNNQNGTWLYARAGWCPGQGVYPLIEDISLDAIPGQNLLLDYELENYTNFLNTGYNGSSHTEPHYKIHAYLIEKSDQHIASANYINLKGEKIMNPVYGSDLSASTLIKFRFKNVGNVAISQPTVKYFINGVLGASEIVNATINSGDSLDYTFTTTASFSAGINYTIAAMVDAAGDQATSDDVISHYISQTVGINDLQELNFKLYPNPATNEFVIKTNFRMNEAELIIVDVCGKIVYQKKINENSLNEIRVKEKLESGIYFVRLNTKENSMIEKLIIQPE